MWRLALLKMQHGNKKYIFTISVKMQVCRIFMLVHLYILLDAAEDLESGSGSSDVEAKYKKGVAIFQSPETETTISGDVQGPWIYIQGSDLFSVVFL